MFGIILYYTSCTGAPAAATAAAGRGTSIIRNGNAFVMQMQKVVIIVVTFFIFATSSSSTRRTSARGSHSIKIFHRSHYNIICYSCMYVYITARVHNKYGAVKIPYCNSSFSYEYYKKCIYSTHMENRCMDMTFQSGHHRKPNENCSSVHFL